MGGFEHVESDSWPSNPWHDQPNVWDDFFFLILMMTFSRNLERRILQLQPLNPDKEMIMFLTFLFHCCNQYSQRTPTSQFSLKEIALLSAYLIYEQNFLSSSLLSNNLLHPSRCDVWRIPTWHDSLRDTKHDIILPASNPNPVLPLPFLHFIYKRLVLITNESEVGLKYIRDLTAFWISHIIFSILNFSFYLSWRTQETE